MTDLLEKFADTANFRFSTNPIVSKSKKKCIAFCREGKQCHLVTTNITLNGAKLPWVQKYKYLGSIVTNKDDCLEADMICKRGTFISNTHKLIQEFRWVGVRNLHIIQ